VSDTEIVQDGPFPQSVTELIGARERRGIDFESVVESAEVVV
jgi:hypothetical protein